MILDTALFEKLAGEMGIELTKRQLCQFCDYYDLLIEWNNKMNLTAITEWDDVVKKHFIDSLSVILCYDGFSGFEASFSRETLADIGTGAGFPGIPLKILFPELSVTLFDSLDKRIRFLNEVIDKLCLQNISAVHGRVEDLARNPEYREKFGIAIARAVAALPVLSEYCLPFVKKDGVFVAMKSEKALDELKDSENALKVLGVKVIMTKSFVLPSTDLGRTIIQVKKEKETPSKYPRKAGTPSKQPL